MSGRPDVSDLAGYKFLPKWTECGICNKKFGWCQKAQICTDCGFGCGPCCMEQDGRCWYCHVERKADASGNPTMPAPKSKFVVLGASLAGSYFAWAMAKRGFEVDVYERNATLGTWSGIINLIAPMAKVLEVHGKLDEILAEHHACTSQLFRGEDWEHMIGESDMRVDPARYNLPPFLVTANRLRLLQQIQEWAMAAGARFHLDKEATDIQQGNGAGGFVKVTFKDGSTAEGDFLIGADGNRSFVRRTLFAKEGGDHEPESTGHWTCNATVQGFAFPEKIAKTDFVNFWGKSGVLGFFPYVDDKMFFYILQKGPRPVHAEGVDRLTYQKELKERLIKDFGDYDPFVKPMLEATDASTFGSFELPQAGRQLTKWTKGRVLLIGDSAHAMCNCLGAGGGTAMEDAHAAAELIELNMRIHGGGEKEAVAITEGFQMTERRRFHRGLKIQKESLDIAGVCVMMAGTRLQGCILPMVKKSMAMKEHERDGAMDFLNSYRVCAEHRMKDK